MSEETVKKAAAKKTVKKAAAKKTVKKAAAKKTEEFKYGVEYLSKKTGLAEATVRLKLRDMNIQRAGKSYGWKTQTEADKVASSLTRE